MVRYVKSCGSSTWNKVWSIWSYQENLWPQRSFIPAEDNISPEKGRIFWNYLYIYIIVSVYCIYIYLYIYIYLAHDLACNVLQLHSAYCNSFIFTIFTREFQALPAMRMEVGAWDCLKVGWLRWLDGFYFKRSQLSNKSWFILWWKIHDEFIVEDNLGEPLCWVISAFGALISRYLTRIVARLEIMFNACMDFVNPFQRNLEIYCPRVASGLPVLVWYCLKIGRFHILQTLATRSV